MSFAIPDQNEGTIIEGNLTVYPSYDNAQEGSLEVVGKIFTNQITEYNTGYGLHLINTQNVTGNTSASLVIYGGTRFIKETSHSTFIELDQINTPTHPTTLKNRLWADLSGTLKVSNSSGNISTLNPLTTKGDLFVHDGTTGTRLPSGLDGQTLQIDSNETTGFKWSNAIGTGTGNGKGGGLTLIGTNKPTSISEELIGTFSLFIYNQIDMGPSGIFFMSKSLHTNTSSNIRMNSSPGITTTEQLELTWTALKEPEISKTGINYDGNYTSQIIQNITTDTITLTGTTWTSISTQTTGNFVIHVTNGIQGPTASFSLSKNNPSNVSTSIQRIVSSPAQSGTRLQMRWTANNGPEIQKNATDFNGTYTINNLLEISTNLTSTITLFNSNLTQIYLKYQRTSTLVSVTSNVSGGSCAIFSITKNHITQNASIVRITQSPGITTNETLRLEWNANDSLKLYKTNSGHNGTYNVILLYQ